MKETTAQLISSQNKRTYNTIAKQFSGTRDRSWPELEMFVKEYVKKRNSILDIGCGNSRLFALLRTKEVKYLGIDNSQELINEAQKNQEHKNTEFLVDDILHLDYKKKFNVIFCIAVLNHIPSAKLRQQAVQNIYRALKPGGYLLMTNWNLWNTKSKKSWWRLKFATAPHTAEEIPLDWNDVMTYWGQEHLPLYYHNFTKPEIKKSLKKEGLKIIKNYYSLENHRTWWWKGKNLMTIAQK